jgi:hypothetical protein
MHTARARPNSRLQGARPSPAPVSLLPYEGEEGGPWACSNAEFSRTFRNAAAVERRVRIEPAIMEVRSRTKSVRRRHPEPGPGDAGASDG